MKNIIQLKSVSKNVPKTEPKVERCCQYFLERLQKLLKKYS